MAQYGTPSADVYDGNWLDQGSSAVDMYLDIVPGTPGSIGSGDDTTYIESELNPSASPVGFDLSSLGDPVSSTGHIMRWRRQKDAAGGGTINLTVQLYQGYTGSGEPSSPTGTLINSYADNDLPSTWTTTSDTLTGGEADTITDYTDLQVRFVATQA